MYCDGSLAASPLPSLDRGVYPDPPLELQCMRRFSEEAGDDGRRSTLFVGDLPPHYDSAAVHDVSSLLLAAHVPAARPLPPALRCWHHSSL